MDGFLNIDTASNVISITEKIESDAGISMKTTGDLMLDVDEFIERGDVQEGRVVKGRHMTFKGNVFGGLAASGNICIEGVLSGGRVESTGGMSRWLACCIPWPSRMTGISPPNIVRTAPSSPIRFILKGPSIARLWARKCAPT